MRRVPVHDAPLALVKYAAKSKSPSHATWVHCAGLKSVSVALSRHDNGSATQRVSTRDPLTHDHIENSTEYSSKAF